MLSGPAANAADCGPESVPAWTTFARGVVGKRQCAGARFGQAAGAAQVAADAHAIICPHRGSCVDGNRPRPRHSRAVAGVERAAVQDQRVGRTGVLKLQRGPAAQRDRTAPRA